VGVAEAVGASFLESPPPQPTSVAAAAANSARHRVLANRALKLQFRFILPSPCTPTRRTGSELCLRDKEKKLGETDEDPIPWDAPQ
jgi:hypothetical protein